MLEPQAKGSVQPIMCIGADDSPMPMHEVGRTQQELHAGKLPRGLLLPPAGLAVATWVIPAFPAPTCCRLT